MVTRDLKYARVGAKAAERSAEWQPGVLRFRKFSKKCEKVAQKVGSQRDIGHLVEARPRSAQQASIPCWAVPHRPHSNLIIHRIDSGTERAERSGTDRAEALSAFLRVRPSDARGLSSDKRSRFIVYTVIHAR